MSGMGEVAHTTTDARGRYSLDLPSSSPYLIRVTHQGAGYFIAAPQGGAPGDIPVYDVAAKVQGIFIEADVIEVESDNGQLKVEERYFVHNTSSPPTTQWSKKSFEIVLPDDAVLNDVGAQRPGGLPTSVKLDPDGPKGHYSFNFPIQPDDGDKNTLFQISYSLPYSSGKYTFKSQISLPADNFAILMPKSMTFTAGSGAAFQSVQEDPGIQTWLLKNAAPGKPIEFTVSGTGSIPREAQNTPAGPQSGNGGQDAGRARQPARRRHRNPHQHPRPALKIQVVDSRRPRAAAFGRRRIPAAQAGCSRPPMSAVQSHAGRFAATRRLPTCATAASKNTALLNALKEELFALESDKISGTITPDGIRRSEGRAGNRAQARAEAEASELVEQ